MTETIDPQQAEALLHDVRALSDEVDALSARADAQEAQADEPIELAAVPPVAGPKILVVHPGASWSTADVFYGLRFGLSAIGAQTAVYQLDVRIARSMRWLRWNWKQSRKADPTLQEPNPRDIGYHAGIGLLDRALRLEPDWILIVSGMMLDVEVVKHLRRCGFKIACLLTESPYDDVKQAEFITNVDVAWTMERSSVARLQAAAPMTRVGYVGHAWHPAVHIPIEAPAEGTPAWDVLFVGTGFPERNEFLAATTLPENTALYGHWTSLGSRSHLRRYLRGGVVGNEAAAHMYRAAKVNLNLMRRRAGAGADLLGASATDEVVAESVNPRVVELAAMGCCFVTDPRAEIAEIFGSAVPVFGSPEELGDLMAALLDDEPWRKRIAADAYEAIRTGHDWPTRAQQILGDLEAGPLTSPAQGRAWARATP